MASAARQASFTAEEMIRAANAAGAAVQTVSGARIGERGASGRAVTLEFGGVSVNGGVGKISGILVGVLVFELLKIALQFMGVESSYTYIAQGLVIIVAVALDLRKYLARK